MENATTIMLFMNFPRDNATFIMKRFKPRKNATILMLNIISPRGNATYVTKMLPGN